MNLEIVMSNRFKKDLKLVHKRGLNLDLLDEVVSTLSRGESLPAKNYDHSLGGKFSEFRECHILPDWLLIYKIESDKLMLFLFRTGSHSDLFD